MKKFVTIITTLLILISFSCKQEKKDGTDKMATVITIHDQLMTKMGTLTKLTAELNSKVDSTEVGIKYDKAKKDLQDAHKSMMDWMKDFGDNFDSDEILNGKALTADKQKLLDEELNKINKLQEQMNSSIKNAEELLSK